MDQWTYIPSNGGTAPDTWRQGTSMFSVTVLETAHSSATSTGGGGTNTNAGTTDFTKSNKSSNLTFETFAPSSYDRGFTEDREWSSKQEHLFSPSTQTVFVPAWTIPPTSAASTETQTLNYTDSEHRHSFDQKTTKFTTGDTSAKSSYARSTGETIDGSATPEDTTSTTTTQFSETFTEDGASTFVTSREETVDEWTSKTTSSGTFGNLTAWTTASGTFTVSTNSTQTETSSSTWTLTHGVTQATTNTAVTVTNPVTYAGDVTTVHASTVTTSDTEGSGSFTEAVTTETITEHAYSQKIDTVVLMHGNRNDGDFNLGDMLWRFTLSGLADAASAVGRMTDLFTSTGVATVTLSDFEKYRTNSIEISNITVSRNTVTSTATVITGTGTATGVDTTDTTIMVTSKNGAPWSDHETCTTTIVTGAGTDTGTAATTGFSDAASNTSTDTHSFAIGDVGTSLSTWTYGSPVSTGSETIFTHSVQVTGYDSGISWTSSTETSVFYSSSFIESRLALHSSASTSMGIVLRSTTTDAALINSHSSYLSGTDTSHFFLGLVSTATTRVFEFHTTTSRSLWDSHFNNEVEQWTTQTTYTLAGGGYGATSGVSEGCSLTNWTKLRALPQIRTTPDGLDAGQFGAVTDSMDRARFSVLPHGYAGFGGTFAASTLGVKFTLTSGVVSGSAFSGQSINFAALPSVSAYPGVTLFPVDSALLIETPGAERLRYVGSLSAIGTATIAATWTSTTTASTTSGTASKVTSRFATYTLAGATPIAGTFFSEEALSTNTEGRFYLIGGYGIGENNLGNPYTVFARSGYAAWTEFAPGDSSAVATFSTSSSAGTVSFTIPGSRAIVFSIEPIFTANWTGDGEIPFYFSSTPHIPFQ